MTHPREEDLILYYYGDPSPGLSPGEADKGARESEDPLAIEEHLQICESCGEDFEDIKRVLAAVEAARVPERSDDYGTVVWHRLRPRLHRRFDVRRTALSPGGVGVGPHARNRLLIAAAVAGLVAGSFLAGRFWPRPDAPPDTPVVAQDLSAVRERVLLVAVGDHLDRSQVLLLDFVNAGNDGKVTEALARDLVASNRLYRQTAAGAGENAVASLLEELEPILLEISHDPKDPELRRRIEAKGLVFKVRVVTSGLRERSPGGKKL